MTKTSRPRAVLKSGKDKPLRRHHPWVFSGAIAKMDQVEPGDLVDIVTDGGERLACAYANPHSQIRCRVISFDPDEAIDQKFWQARIDAAVARRQHLFTADQTAARLVMSEADQLPGMIVDRYGDYLVVQALTAGMACRVAELGPMLMRATGARGVYERSDDAVRELEGLSEQSGLLCGEAPPVGGIAIRENGIALAVDFVRGHKTGFYLDQRQNHLKIREYCAGARVLDAFAFTGGFAMNALKAGAKEVVSLDASATALDQLDANLVLNGWAKGAVHRDEGDAFVRLRALRDAGERFDVVVLDPPKFAAHAAQLDKAARGYKDVNLLAFKLLRPGGVLATFSCSGHVSLDLFQKIVFGAASDAGREAQIMAFGFQADDHPVLLSFPESLYLKGMFLRVL
jgi:23S rRNA (cytosine1962-C5)-methyltransferase